MSALRVTAGVRKHAYFFIRARTAGERLLYSSSNVSLSASSGRKSSSSRCVDTSSSLWGVQISLKGLELRKSFAHLFLPHMRARLLLHLSLLLPRLSQALGVFTVLCFQFSPSPLQCLLENPSRSYIMVRNELERLGLWPTVRCCRECVELSFTRAVLFILQPRQRRAE